MEKKKLKLSLIVMCIQNEKHQPNAIKHMGNNFTVYTIKVNKQVHSALAFQTLICYTFFQ